MEDKQARLVERRRNTFHGGPCELWDIGDGRGIFVDCRECLHDTGKPKTMAFLADIRQNKINSWDPLGTWYEDATGGRAIRELGYETVEED